MNVVDLLFEITEKFNEVEQEVENIEFEAEALEGVQAEIEHKVSTSRNILEELQEKVNHLSVIVENKSPIYFAIKESRLCGAIVSTTEQFFDLLMDEGALFFSRVPGYYVLGIHGAKPEIKKWEAVGGIKVLHVSTSVELVLSRLGVETQQ